MGSNPTFGTTWVAWPAMTTDGLEGAHVRCLRSGPLVVAAAAALAGGAACDTSLGARTFEPGVEHLPGPGYVDITTDPPRTDRDLVFRLVGPDGQTGFQSDTVPRGQAANAHFIDLPGRHGLIVNGSPCAGSFMLETDRVTHVVVRFGRSGGCVVSTTRIGPVPTG